MGEVYLAEHQLLKRPCAVKLIRPGVVTDPRALERFEREVRLTATLSHPNTVEIYDYGRAEDGTYYYVMEYLQGLSLAELVERHGPLPPGAGGLPAAAGLRGVARGARRRPDPPRHQAVEHLRRAPRGAWTTWPSCSTSGWSCPRRSSARRTLTGEGQILGTPLLHVAGAGQGRP